MADSRYSFEQPLQYRGIESATDELWSAHRIILATSRPGPRYPDGCVRRDRSRSRARSRGRRCRPIHATPSEPLQVFLELSGEDVIRAVSSFERLSKRDPGVAGNLFGDTVSHASSGTQSGRCIERTGADTGSTRRFVRREPRKRWTGALSRGVYCGECDCGGGAIAIDETATDTPHRRAVCYSCCASGTSVM